MHTVQQICSVLCRALNPNLGILWYFYVSYTCACHPTKWPNEDTTP